MDDEVPLDRKEHVKTHRSLWQRLEAFATSVLIASTIGILTSIGFISFLWFADDKSDTWRLLASRDWMTNAVTISSLVLRTSITLQAGIATSMLAGIALERSRVLLSQLASVSTIRNSNSGPYSLSWLLWSSSSVKVRGLRGLHLSLLVLILSVVTVMGQFTSTILLSDVRLGLVAGFPELGGIPTNLINGSGSPFFTSLAAPGWLQRPSSYASFAEFPSKSFSGNGFEDTGLSLRDFLPISEQQDRVSVKDYNGPATVVDTRVVCFTPQISYLSVGSLTGDGSQEGAFALDANIIIPHDVVQTYNDHSENTSSLVDYGVPPPSISTVPGKNGTYNITKGINFVDCEVNIFAPVTFCQVLATRVSGSFLVGQFQAYPQGNGTPIWENGYDDTGNQYLIIKTTTSGIQPDLLLNSITKETFPTHNSTDGVWVNTVFEPGGANATLQLDISLCYNSLSAIDIPIKASTNTSRREVSPAVGNGSPNFTNVLTQLGMSGGSPNDRGLLELSFPSGLPNGRHSTFSNNSDYINALAQSPGAPALSSYAGPTNPIYFASTNQLPPNSAGSETSALIAQSDLVNFLTEMLASGGSITFAMQSLITVLAGSLYYEQLPNFDNITFVEKTRLVQAQIPAGKGAEYHSAVAGFQRGYIVVLVLTLIHVFLMIGIISWFSVATTISSLGNAWQTIAQIQDEATMEYIAKASLATDSEVEEWIRGDGCGERLVGIEVGGMEKGTSISGIGGREEDGGIERDRGAEKKSVGFRERTPVVAEYEDEEGNWI